MIQVSLWVLAVSLRSFQHGKEDHTGVGAGLGVAEKPVLPADHNRPDRVFHLVVADFYLAMVEERAKELPLVKEYIIAFFSLPAGLKMVSSQA